MAVTSKSSLKASRELWRVVKDQGSRPKPNRAAPAIWRRRRLSRRRILPSGRIVTLLWRVGKWLDIRCLRSHKHHHDRHRRHQPDALAYSGWISNAIGPL